MLNHKLKGKHIVLASGSPRRKELFNHLGIPFSVKIKQIEENYPPTLKREEITNYLARLKASAFSDELNENDIIITADTIVWFQDKALEKPLNKKEAIDMLQKLSGTHHEVITSICIRTANKEIVIFDTTKVFFKDLTEKELNYYVINYQPFDKAGSYGIQEWIGFIGVTRIEGSYFNVMGLPVHKLYEELLKL